MMASYPLMSAGTPHPRALVLYVMLLALLLVPASCLAASPGAGARGPSYNNYTDGLNDVMDKTTDTMTSGKPMYDISNASCTLGNTSAVVRMTMASGLDRDGFYIFQCEVNGAKGYKFYFSKDAFGGLSPGAVPITVSGVAMGNYVEITVLRSLLGTVSAFDLDNVSAQDANLNHIDVLDCASQRFTVQANNAITLSIFSVKQLLLRQVATYSDTKALKDGMDTDNNGYVDVPESQGCARSLQSDMSAFISNNTDAYYGSGIYVNGERPWDISVQVYIWIDEPAVSKADGSSITIDYYITYQKGWGSSITLSLPPGFLGGNLGQGTTTFSMELPKGYSIDRDATDERLRQSVFDNGSGLSMDDTEFKALTAVRYDIAVKTPLKDTEGTGSGIYVIITIISVTIAFCIFVGYKMLTKRREGGAGGADVRGGPKARGCGEADGKQDKGARRGKKNEDRGGADNGPGKMDRGRPRHDKKLGDMGRRGQGQRPRKKGRGGGTE
jgi:hypothetical protein